MNEQTENPNMELFASLVKVNCRHDFSFEERLEKSVHISQLISDIEIEKARKKTAAAEFKNKIDLLEAEAKLIAGHITNGFAMMDKNAEMWLDYSRHLRVYKDKQDGTVLKTEPFHTSDFERRQIKLFTEDEIEFNNEIGNYSDADGESGSHGFKPTPKDNLGEHYGKFHIIDAQNDYDDETYPNIEPPEEWGVPDENGLHLDHNGNLTDIHPRDLANELKDHPETVDINAKVKAQVEEFKKTKANSKR